MANQWKTKSRRKPVTNNKCDQFDSESTEADSNPDDTEDEDKNSNSAHAKPSWVWVTTILRRDRKESTENSPNNNETDLLV